MAISRRYLSASNWVIVNFIVVILASSLSYQSSWSQSFFEVMIQQNIRILYFACFIGSVLLILYSLVGYLTGNTLMLMISGALSIGNYLKVEARQEPLLWNDLTNGLIKEVVWDMLLLQHALLVAIGMLLFSVLMIYLFKKDKWSISLKKRFIFCFLGIMIGGNIFLNPQTILAELGIQVYPNDIEANLEENGPGLYFLLSRNGTFMSSPDNYSEETMKEIVEKLTNQYETARDESEEEPTVIYILSEGFTDPTSFEGTEWKEDPMPTIRALQEENGGYMLSSVFGGGTANVEYSVLTGFSYELLNSGSLPYTYVYENPTRNMSVVSLFNEKGYDTVAIHPYSSDSYNRSDVFESFGFDSFISEENLETYTDVNWYPSEGYMSDDSFVNGILYAVRTNSTKQFIHGTSMQNHYPYTTSGKGALLEEDNLLENIDDISDGEQLALYARGIKKTDNAIRHLIEELSKLEEPVYVLFYGDHLPALNSSLYENNLTTFDDQGVAQYLTPYFIWSNTGTDGSAKEISNPEFLGAELLKEVGSETSIYYQFIQGLSEEISAFNLSLGLYIQDEEVLEKLDAETQEQLDMYKLIMYDMLCGGKYSQLLFE